MSELIHLTPGRLWFYFSEILKIPRPSDHEEKIREYLIQFADKNNLEYEVDRVGNVVIRKAPHPEYQSAPLVCLQSHLDMICEKNSNVIFDFHRDSINAYIDGEWVKAKGTTLGADDGIGIAAQLAILESSHIKHGPLECLFTVAEETGLTGAFGLEPGFLTSKVLINLDSEDEGELFIGCAGGQDLTAWLGFQKAAAPPDFKSYEVSISGLKGGHSGDDIHKGLGNANKLLNRFIWESAARMDVRLHSFDGGNLRNAIAREAKATIGLPENMDGLFQDHCKKYFEEIRAEFQRIEPDLQMEWSEIPKADWFFDGHSQTMFLNAVYGCPHGVIAWSQTIPGLVETSTNLAAIKIEGDLLKITTSQRSSVASAKRDVSQMVESVFKLSGARVEKSTGYPGWNPNPDSKVLGITQKAYTDLFNQDPQVKAIHAGLECGLFLEKYPDLDMVSFGPTIKGAHSPDERLHIPSTIKFWQLLTEVLERLK